MRDDGKILVTNIQHFCLHDGPGIRTTVFLKGCSIHCPWCANLENIKAFPEKYQKEIGEGVYGKYLSREEIKTEILKDRVYYSDHGGVTWSGGEPLLQFQKLRPLLCDLKNRQVHQSVETALYVPQDLLEIALLYMDLFLIDIKILNYGEAEKILGGDLDLYLKNIKKVFAHKKRVIFRVPLIEPYTSNCENQKEILEFLKIYRPEKVELIKGHNLAESKYRSLKKEMLHVSGPSDETIWSLQKEIQKLGIAADICKF